MRSVTPPPKRTALLEVPKGGGHFSSPNVSSVSKEMMTSSPVTLPRQTPIKVSDQECFCSPRPKAGDRAAIALQAGKENMMPVPLPPVNWASPAPAQTPLLKTPSRMPVVEEEAELGGVGETVGFQVALGLEAKLEHKDVAVDEKDINYMPAWISASPVPAPGLTPGRELEDDPLGFAWGSPMAPKVRNTFLQFESPLKFTKVSSPPKSVPPHFAPVGSDLVEQCPVQLRHFMEAVSQSSMPGLPSAAADGAAAATPGLQQPAEEQQAAQESAQKPEGKGVIELRLDDFLAPAAQPSLAPQGADMQQPLTDQMQMMQWLCSMAMSAASPEQQQQQPMGTPSFGAQANPGCLPTQLCMGTAQPLPMQDCINQLGVNLSAVPPMADSSAQPFMPTAATFDSSMASFSMQPFGQPQAQAPMLQQPAFGPPVPPPAQMPAGAPMAAVPPFPMSSTTEMAPASSQQPPGRISISVAHFPEPGAAAPVANLFGT